MQVLEPGTLVDERYRITRLLGQGGAGITYEAIQLSSDRRVALKALSLRGMRDWKVLELFERESEVLAQLDHSGIPRYIDHFRVEHEGSVRFWTVQEIAEGQTLDALVRTHRRLTETQVRPIARQLLEILRYLHARTPPIVHRDIKPQNVIRGQRGKVRLVDFGACQVHRCDRTTTSGTIVGTYAYMAPEQARGQAKPASDLFSLAMTLVYLLTGKAPAELPQRRLKVDFRGHAKVSRRFADWLDKLLEPVVEDRTASAEAALAALRAFDRPQKQKRAVPPPPRFTRALVAGNVLFASLFCWQTCRHRPDRVRIIRVPVVKKASQRSVPVRQSPNVRRPPSSLHASPSAVRSKAHWLAKQVRLSPTLVSRLQADVDTLAKKATEPWAFAGARRILSQLTPPAGARQYQEALATLRRLRPKAAIPLLLSAPGLSEPRLNRYELRRIMTSLLHTLTILSGKALPTGPSDYAALLTQLARAWWFPQKQRITTQLSRMSREELDQVTFALVRRQALPSYTSVAQTWRRVVSTNFTRPNRSHSYPKAWFESDLHPRMVPSLLQSIDSPATVAAAYPLLASLSARGARTMISAASHTGPPYRRFAALLALWRAGEDFDGAGLLELFQKNTSSVDLRVAVLVAMTQAPSGPELVRALKAGLNSRNREVRTASLYAFTRHAPAGLLPDLERLAQRASTDQEVGAVYDVLRTFIGNHQAQAIVARLMTAELARGGAGHQRRLNRALYAFRQITGHRLKLDHKASAASKARQALAWWQQRASRR